MTVLTVRSLGSKVSNTLRLRIASRTIRYVFGLCITSSAIRWHTLGLGVAAGTLITKTFGLDLRAASLTKFLFHIHLSCLQFSLTASALSSLV
jgi:hypothetical protein